MVFRAKARWRWFLLVGGVLVAPPFLFVAVFVAIHSDPHDRQTPGQKLAFSAIFLAIAAAGAYAPWAAWTGRLLLSDTSIKVRWGFRPKEIFREQIHSYSMQPGVRMGMLGLVSIQIQPPSLLLLGADNTKLMRVPGYFEGEPDLRAWLDQAVAVRSGPSRG
jgi:hypothetical protein